MDGSDFEQLGLHGEFVVIRERVVVSPSWGRLRPEALGPGQRVDVGTAIGWIQEGGRELPLRSHVRGSFVRWLARRGERIAPGDPVALLQDAGPQATDSGEELAG